MYSSRLCPTCDRVKQTTSVSTKALICVDPAQYVERSQRLDFCLTSLVPINLYS